MLGKLYVVLDRNVKQRKISALLDLQKGADKYKRIDFINTNVRCEFTKMNEIGIIFVSNSPWMGQDDEIDKVEVIILDSKDSIIKAEPTYTFVEFEIIDLTFENGNFKTGLANFAIKYKYLKKPIEVKEEEIIVADRNIIKLSRRSDFVFPYKKLRVPLDIMDILLRVTYYLT